MNNLNNHDSKSLYKDCLIRLLDQCFKYNFHHLGSAFSSLPILLEIYKKMQESETFVLSNGHAAAALYIVLEKVKKRDSSILFEVMGEHPHRDDEWGISCSTGSLGMGISVAVGMALANKNQNVYCLVSDGECTEGIFWESIRFAKKEKLDNLKIYVNINGWAGYDEINRHELAREINCVNSSIKIEFTDNFPFESYGLDAHYMNLTTDIYEKSKEKICEKYS